MVQLLPQWRHSLTASLSASPVLPEMGLQPILPTGSLLPFNCEGAFASGGLGVLLSTGLGWTSQWGQLGSPNPPRSPQGPAG